MTSPKRSTPKSIRTRQAIETAARELFALNGFDRTTVREIGARAAIDPSMIIRYFGSKDALFTRVTTPDLRLSVLEEVSSARVGESIVRHFLAVWEDEISGSGMRVLLRSASSNDEAADRMRAVFLGQVVPAMERVGPPETAALRAALVTTQLIGLALARYVLCLPPVVAMTPEYLIRTVGPAIQSYATSNQARSDG
jgi:AcrR family transcriptional regulator